MPSYKQVYGIDINEEYLQETPIEELARNISAMSNTIFTDVVELRMKGEADKTRPPKEKILSTPEEKEAYQKVKLPKYLYIDMYNKYGGYK